MNLILADLIWLNKLWAWLCGLQFN